MWPLYWNSLLPCWIARVPHAFLTRGIAPARTDLRAWHRAPRGTLSRERHDDTDLGHPPGGSVFETKDRRLATGQRDGPPLLQFDPVQCAAAMVRRNLLIATTKNAALSTDMITMLGQTIESPAPR